MSHENIRIIEDGVQRDFADRMSYGGYLSLPQVLSAQQPISQHPDELLFIVQHQTTELWLKQVLHELQQARLHLAADRLRSALKCLTRVKHIQKVLTEQWAVLATLTPTEYAQFRSVLGSSSGFQSYNYRAVEFVLGNKHPGMLRVHASDPDAHALLSAVLEETTVYDEFLRLLARRGYGIPDEVLSRDVREQWVEHPELVPIFQDIYEHPEEHWDLYEACEDLVDLEDNFQMWRFRHLRTVQRTIGFKTGTGGSSGVGFLKRALDLTFFPELYAVRTEIRDLPYEAL